MILVLKQLGVEISPKPHKRILPCQHIKFLGLWLSSNHKNKGIMRVTIDKDKMEETKSIFNKICILNKNAKVPIKLIEKLVGKMVFLSQTTYGARGMYKNLLKIIHDPKFNGKVDKNTLLDFYQWNKIIQKYDGTALAIEKPQLSGLYWATDAFRTPNNGEITHAGIGSFFNGHYICIAGKIRYFREQLFEKANPLLLKNKNIFPCNPKKPHSFNIQYLELFAVYWDLCIRTKVFKNKHLPLRIDNKNALSWIIKASGPIPYMGLIRAIVQILHDNNIRVYPVYVTSESNKLADLASRGEIDELKKLIPEWKNKVALKEIFERPRHLIPGPLFLFGKGYVNGEMTKLAWEANNIEINS